MGALLCLPPWFTSTAKGQDAGDLQLAALQQALIETIARNEKSVVSIARVRNEILQERGFNPQVLRSSPLDDPDFIPTEYGTGVVVDAKGLILTNYHVLGEEPEGNTLYLTTHDRRVHVARIKAADPRSDLAVLEIKATGLKPVRFGDANKIRKGQIVIALGNPYAIARDGQASASWGIIANLQRKAPPELGEYQEQTKPTLHNYGTLIQTDAKLNYGTSGGPLLNLSGEMIGLTSSMAALEGYEQAAGYAIGVDDTFQRVVTTLKQGREVEYGFLGVSPSNTLRSDGGQLVPQVRIDRVLLGTPAQKAGLRGGDIVTAVDGEAIYDVDGLMLRVGRAPVEAIVRLTVYRDGREIEITPAVTKYPVRGKKFITQPVAARRGMVVDYPTAIPDFQAIFPNGAIGEGLVIVRVDEGSPAASAELQPQLLVTHIGATRVQTPRQFYSALDAQPAEPVKLRVRFGSDDFRVVTVDPDGS
jgi:serine protease Do